MNRTLTVSELNEYIKASFETDEILADIYIKGEISNFTNHYKTGHYYFTLKDEGGVLSAVMFRFNASRLKFMPENGMKVLAHGRISSYVKSGQYQLYADDMEPDGVGSLYQAFEQLKAKLAGEGLFDERHKKPIPEFSERIGIITAATGAAIRDMINIASRRFPMTELVLFPCLVQGEGAAQGLASGIRFFNAYNVDLIIIGRGGGSLEDLWAFNDERLAREIFASKKPVISAVGHEIDFSISDFAADLRAPTPSTAAELALPDAGEIRAWLRDMEYRLPSLLKSNIEYKKKLLSMLSSKPILTSYQNVLDDRRLAVDSLSARIDSAMANVIEKKKLMFERSLKHIEALNPISIISRGYSAVFLEDGSLIKSIDDVSAGDKVSFRTIDGVANAEIISKKKKSAKSGLKG